MEMLKLIYGGAAEATLHPAGAVSDVSDELARYHLIPQCPMFEPSNNSSNSLPVMADPLAW